MSESVPPQLPQQPPPIPPNSSGRTPMPQYRYEPPRRTTAPSQTFAALSLVLGIIGLLGSVCYVGIVFAAVGITLGILHLRAQDSGRALAWTGIVLSGLAFVVVLVEGAIFAFFFSGMFGDMRDEMEMHRFAEWEGVRAPEFDVTTSDGKTLKLSELKGQRVVVCVLGFSFGKNQTRSDLDTLATELAGTTTFIGVNSDSGGLDSFGDKDKDAGFNIASSELPLPYGDAGTETAVFFIDRKGVIDHVVEGKRSLERLRSFATAPDYAWKVKDDPSDPEPSLTDSATPLNPTQLWKISIVNRPGLCVGDLNQDGVDEIGVVESSGKLQAYDLEGKKLNSIQLPPVNMFGLRSLSAKSANVPRMRTKIEFGVDKAGGPRLLACDLFPSTIQVLDLNGKELWSQSSSMGLKVAHWGDLDGDGSDEMVTSTIGFGGLQAYTPSGKSLWNHRGVGPLGSCAIIPAYGDRKGFVIAPGTASSLRVYNHEGRRADPYAPSGLIYNYVTAAQLDDKGLVQILAIGKSFTPDRELVVAFDLAENKAWSVTALPNMDITRDQQFRCGDADGDGIKDWVFPDSSNDLIFVSHDGTKLGALKGGGYIERFEVIPRYGRSSLLIFMTTNELIASSLEPVPADPPESASQGSVQAEAPPT